MATATKQARSTSRAGGASDGVPSEFLVAQNNAGDYHWSIVAAGGATLAQSGPFASFADAEDAAVRVRDGAASARLQRRSADER